MEVNEAIYPLVLNGETLGEKPTQSPSPGYLPFHQTCTPGIPGHPTGPLRWLPPTLVGWVLYYSPYSAEETRLGLKPYKVARASIYFFV